MSSPRRWKAIGGFTRPAESLVVIGILAFLAAEFTTFVSVRFIGWALLFGGVAQFLTSVGGPPAAKQAFAPGLINGVLYFVAGGFLLARPISGIVAITLLVARDDDAAEWVETNLVDLGSGVGTRGELGEVKSGPDRYWSRR